MYDPVLVTAPTVAPVSLDEVKAHLRVIELDVDGTALPNEDDGLIQSYIDAAVSHLDGWSGVLGRCLVSQTWRQDYDCFAQCLRLTLAPVVSVSAVTYRDAAGDETTLDAGDYALEITGGGTPIVWIKTGFTRPSSLYDRRAVSVEFVAGYGDAAAVPQALKHAILLLVGHWYENRDAVTVGTVGHQLPMAVNALIAPYRRMSV